MERLALCYRAKPEKRQEYIKAHKEIWPEITQGLRFAGCKEMTIFIRGDLLFLFGLIENIEEFNQIRAKDHYYKKWSKWMDELLVSPYDENEAGAFAPLEEIWRFEA